MRTKRSRRRRKNERFGRDGSAADISRHRARHCGSGRRSPASSSRRSRSGRASSHVAGGGLWQLVMAFEEDDFTGWLHMRMPGYSLYFAITRISHHLAGGSQCRPWAWCCAFSVRGARASSERRPRPGVFNNAKDADIEDIEDPARHSHASRPPVRSRTRSRPGNTRRPLPSFRPSPWRTHIAISSFRRVRTINSERPSRR